MSKKTPEQAAIEWANEWAWDGVMYWKLPDGDEQLLGMQFAVRAFLAGRKHFIENELEEYLEMAKHISEHYKYGEFQGISEKYTINEILQKARED